MAIVLGNTTITGLAAGGLPAGSITAANMASSGSWAPSGAVIRTTAIRNSSGRVTIPGSQTYDIFSGTFTKERADSVIIATFHMFGEEYSSGNCGIGMKCDGNWDHGGAYQYNGAWGAYQTTVVYGIHRWTGIAAGSRSISVGFRTLDGGGGNRPFVYLNPNSSTPSDNRNQQIVSSIFVYEVAP